MDKIEQEIDTFSNLLCLVSSQREAVKYAESAVESAKRRVCDAQMHWISTKSTEDARYCELLSKERDRAHEEHDRLREAERQNGSRISQWIDYFWNTATIQSLEQEIRLDRLVAEFKLGDQYRFAQRAAQRKCQSPEESQTLIAYFKEKSLWNDAITVARQGYEQFHGDVFKKEWLDLLEKAGRRDELIALLQEDLDKSPGNLELVRRIAQLLLKRKGLNEAVAFLNAEIGKVPHNQELRKHLRAFLGDLLEKNGKIDDLIALLQEDLDKSPGNLELVRRIAQLLEKAGRLDNLLTFLQENLEKSPGDLELTERIAQLLLKAKGLDEAVAFLNAEIGKVPHNQELRKHLLRALLSNLLEKSGKIDDLIALLREDPEKSPGNLKLAERIAQLLLKTKGLNEVAAFLSAEKDVSVRQALMASLGKLDHAPRKWWEKLLGRRPWAK